MLMTCYRQSRQRGRGWGRNRHPYPPQLSLLLWIPPHLQSMHVFTGNSSCILLECNIRSIQSNQERGHFLLIFTYTWSRSNSIPFKNCRESFTTCAPICLSSEGRSPVIIFPSSLILSLFHLSGEPRTSTALAANTRSCPSFRFRLPSVSFMAYKTSNCIYKHTDSHTATPSDI